ncbi:M23 family metallopeptidase [Pseudoalteromonas sp. NBT06-2]|uniref:M23 family metallopeptidase n=1 Tax=Pseudoalteromonas sp. NBT06-2 TaxID=2025950 RepID=UPI00336C0AB7
MKHKNGYQSLYAHLNGFASGIKKGIKVKQGQVIGYLGNTGLSQGRHLHFEIHEKW